MKAISLWQPWASALACGSKRIETRHWECPKSVQDQYVAIHAAKKWSADQRVFMELLDSYGIPLGFEGDPPFGGIVGVGRIISCRKTSHIFGDDFENPSFSKLLIDEGGCDIVRGSGKLNTQMEYLLGNFGPDRFAWVFVDVQPVPLIPYRGEQGFFNLPMDVTAKVLEAVRGPES